MENEIRRVITNLIYTADAKPRRTFTDGSPLEKKLALINEAVRNILILVEEPRKICYWSGVDVKMKVDELNDSSEYKIDCTDGFINAVLDVVEDRFDANYGVTWEHIEDAIIHVVEQDKI